jgi:phage protein D
VTGSAAGGPTALVVDRSVDVPLDLARLRVADGAGIAVGDPVTVALGLDASPSGVFTGTVAEACPSVDGTTFVAVGSFQALLDLHVAVSYADRTVGGIARDLATQASLAVGTVEDGPLLPRFAVDARRNALEQLRDLAGRFGLDLYADRRGRLLLQPLPEPSGGPGVPAVTVAARATLGYGREVLDAGSRHHRSAWESVSVGGQSPSSSRGASTTAWLTTDDDVARGDAGSGSRRLHVTDPLARTKALARAAAEGRLRRATVETRILTARVPGRPDLDLGDDVQAEAMPAGLPAGRGQVRWLRHRLDGRTGFTTTVGVAVPPAAAPPGLPS